MRFVVFLFFYLSLCAGMAGCVSMGKQKEIVTDPALEILSNASMRVHEEMMTTSALMRGGKPPVYQTVLPMNYSLVVPVEGFNWVGPAWPAVERIASKINYTAELYGRPPLSEPTIAVNSKPSGTVYDLLNDINSQVRASKGQLLIDTINRQIVLLYAN